ncbi:MAG: aminotransferase class IV [Bdellovibrionales bacterium]
MIIYHNGAFIKDAAIFGLNDRIRLGDGIFDTMLVIVKNAAPQCLKADLHFERLIHDANMLHIPIKTTPEILHKTAMDLAGKNNLPDGRYALNTLITRGAGQRGLMPPDMCAPTLSMRLSPVPDTFPPITAIISQTTRRNEFSPLSQIKSCNYGDNILALIEAKGKGANEAILLNTAGHVACATAGNIFVEINGRLFTPPLSDGAMNGITRKIMLQNGEAVERTITAKDLQTAANLYTTNSIRGRTPVTLIT